MAGSSGEVSGPAANPLEGAIASLNKPGPVVGGVNALAGALDKPAPVVGGVNPPAGAIAALNASGTLRRTVC